MASNLYRETHVDFGQQNDMRLPSTFGDLVALQ